jgi:hypothetical protein
MSALYPGPHCTHVRTVLKSALYPAPAGTQRGALTEDGARMARNAKSRQLGSRQLFGRAAFNAARYFVEP